MPRLCLVLIFMFNIGDKTASQTTDNQEIWTMKPNTFISLSGLGCPDMGWSNVGSQFPFTNPNFTADLGYGGFYRCFFSNHWNTKLLIVVKENKEPQFTITPNKNISHGDNITIRFKHEFDFGMFVPSNTYVTISNGNIAWNRSIMTLNSNYTESQWTLFNGSVDITADYMNPNFTYVWTINKPSIPFFKNFSKSIVLEIQAAPFNISVNSTTTCPGLPINCTALGMPPPDFEWNCIALDDNTSQTMMPNNSNIYFNTTGEYSCKCTAHNMVYGQSRVLTELFNITVQENCNNLNSEGGPGPSTTGQNGNNAGLIAGVVVGVGGAILVSAIVAAVFYTKKKKRNNREVEDVPKADKVNRQAKVADNLVLEDNDIYWEGRPK